MSRFLVVPNVRSSESNAINCGFLVGGAPVLPAMMLAHALGRRLNNNNALSIAYIHHDIALLGERVFGAIQPQQRRGASYMFESGKSGDYVSGSTGPTLSSQPVANARIRMSLIIEFENPVDSLDEVRWFLEQGRLAGGRINAFDAPLIEDDEDSALGRIATGFVTLDRSDLIPRPSDGDPLAALVQHLGQRPENPDNTWLSATHLGYAPITAEQPRGGARDGYDHAYAEPLVGLIQFRSIRQFAHEATRAFWRPRWTSEGAFVLQQTH